MLSYMLLTQRDFEMTRIKKKKIIQYLEKKIFCSFQSIYLNSLDYLRLIKCKKRYKLLKHLFVEYYDATVDHVSKLDYNAS